MTSYKFILPNGHIFSFDNMKQVESTICLNIMQKHSIYKTAKLANYLGITDVHFNDGSRLLVSEDEHLLDYADGMEIYDELSLEKGV